MLPLFFRHKRRSLGGLSPRLRPRTIKQKRPEPTILEVAPASLFILASKFVAKLSDHIQVNVEPITLHLTGMVPEISLKYSEARAEEERELVDILAAIL